jgi:hypothetical protein
MPPQACLWLASLLRQRLHGHSHRPPTLAAAGRPHHMACMACFLLAAGLPQGSMTCPLTAWGGARGRCFSLHPHSSICHDCCRGPPALCGRNTAPEYGHCTLAFGAQPLQAQRHHSPDFDTQVWCICKSAACQLAPCNSTCLRRFMQPSLSIAPRAHGQCFPAKAGTLGPTYSVIAQLAHSM